MQEAMKKELAALIVTTVEEFFANESRIEEHSEAPMEMLTINEAAQEIKGLSVHTVRQLVIQGKIPSIRTGAGKSGKILVPKAALIKYLSGGATPLG